MKNLRKKITLVTGMLAAAGVVAGGIVACSSEDTVVTTDGGGGEPDSGPGVDGNVNPPDTGADTSVVDAGPDRIVVEAGSLADFVAANAEATCQRYAECCSPGNDAGFDFASCIKDFGGSGWDQTITEVTAAGVENGGRLTFDPAVASACLTAVRNMTCKGTSAAEFKNAWVQCFAAIHGTQAAGQPCRNNVECVTTAYCDPNVDGGTCTALRTANAGCEAIGTFSGAECSYRSAGSTQCLPNGDAGTICQNGLANGVDCNRDWDCQSGACNPTTDPTSTTGARCDTMVDFTSGICDFYKPDGG